MESTRTPTGETKAPFSFRLHSRRAMKKGGRNTSSKPAPPLRRQTPSIPRRISPRVVGRVVAFRVRCRLVLGHCHVKTVGDEKRGAAHHVVVLLHQLAGLVPGEAAEACQPVAEV